jgi:hypothetical protein
MKIGNTEGQSFLKGLFHPNISVWDQNMHVDKDRIMGGLRHSWTVSWTAWLFDNKLKDNHKVFRENILKIKIRVLWASYMNGKW